jgi:hypothetical protein
MVPARKQGNEGRELHNLCRTLQTVHMASQEYKGCGQAADRLGRVRRGVCFIPDPVNGVPHVMYGMSQIIEVA